MITKGMIENIMDKSLKRKNRNNYTGKLLKVAYDNNLWNTDVVALALLVSLDVKYCKDENTILDCLNERVRDPNGNKFESLSEDESYSDENYNGSFYKKLYESWDINDYYFRNTFEEYLDFDRKYTHYSEWKDWKEAYHDWYVCYKMK